MSSDAKSPLNAMNIDVEDYFHVAALAGVVRPKQWDSLPSRIERESGRLMELFGKHGVKATFFVLGWVPERFPTLVKSLSDHGHEIASHGYSHQLTCNQSPEIFREAGFTWDSGFFSYPVFRYLFRSASGFGERPQIFYPHLGKIDPDQPHYRDANWFSRFRHYTNLDRCYKRLERLLQDFSFGTVSQSYNAYDPDETLLRSNQIIRLA